MEEIDIPQLPYIEAIVKETMRKHLVAGLLAPHLALEDCDVVGYKIQKGTRVFVNTWSIGRDSLVRDAPEVFRPERFLGKDIDVKGQNFELLPFGSGRRMCPGYSFGLKVISSTLANMLQGFKWKLPENTKNEDLSMDEVYGFATSCKFPLVAVMEPQLPVKIARHTIRQSNTRQATSVIGNAIAVEVKSTSRATRVVGSAALADKQCSDQATQRASTPDLISTEVLEVIEAVPHHEFFIQ